MFTALAIRSILPEALILVLALVLLAVEPFLKPERRRALGWITAGGLTPSSSSLVAFGLPAAPVTTFGTTIRFDWLAFLLQSHLPASAQQSRPCSSWITTGSAGAARRTS